MWSMEKLYREGLPANWILYQIMCLVDATTFEMYLKNMGQLMMEKITNCDMLIFNRCNEQLRAQLRSRNLRMANRRADIYLENENGVWQKVPTTEIGSYLSFEASGQTVQLAALSTFPVWWVWIVLAGLAALLVLLIIAAAVFLLRSCTDGKTPDPAPGGIVYDPGAVEGGWNEADTDKIVDALNEKVEQGMINISMNTAPYFEDGKAEGNVMIVNESINNYPQQVEFIRNDTGEQVYQSNAIPVGSKIERAALDVELPAGTYECTAMFHNLAPESGAIIGTAGAIITITIQHKF